MIHTNPPPFRPRDYAPGDIDYSWTEPQRPMTFVEDADRQIRVDVRDALLCAAAGAAGAAAVLAIAFGLPVLLHWIAA